MVYYKRQFKRRRRSMKKNLFFMDSAFGGLAAVCGK